MSLNIPLPTAADITRMTYDGAERLRREQRSGIKPTKLDFSTAPTCFNCDLLIMGRKPSVCSGCRSVVFCSKKCHTANWKAGNFGTKGHKYFCAKNKVHMEKVVLVQALLKQFPWGRLETDDTFAEPLVRAYYNVLGARGLGYWSTPGGNKPHLSHPSDSHSSSALQIDGVEGYEHGYMLLSDKMLTDETGWKLEKGFIPRLTFEPGTEPEIASKANITDWDSWYKWRKIPKESPVALLMHYPLSVYQLLVHVLHITGPNKNSLGSRQALNVHYVGAEVELNMLPLFSELALLLPYTDIKLTFFGVAVYTIVNKAKKNSVAMRAKQSEPVYTYTSPTPCGASTLSIYLHGKHENWDPQFPFFQNNRPDAIVALNAGLNSYPAWPMVTFYCLAENLPFAVTEYAEQSAEIQRDDFPRIVERTLPHLSSAPAYATKLKNLTRYREHPIVFNPFQRPGQRNLGSTRLPNVPNGFTLRVVGDDPQETDQSISTGVPASELLCESEQLSLDCLD